MKRRTGRMILSSICVHPCSSVVAAFSANSGLPLQRELAAATAVDDAVRVREARVGRAGQFERLAPESAEAFADGPRRLYARLVAVAHYALRVACALDLKVVGVVEKEL